MGFVCAPAGLSLHLVGSCKGSLAPRPVAKVVHIGRLYSAPRFDSFRHCLLR